MFKKSKLAFTRLSSNFEVILPEDLNSLKGGESEDWDILDPVIVTPPPEEDPEEPDPGYDPEPDEPIDPNPESEWEDWEDFLNEIENGGTPPEESLTPEEWWIIRHPGEALLANRNSQEAKSKSRNTPGQVGGVGDAFRHAYWMFMNTRDFGADLARELGVAHEDSNPDNNAADRRMDLANNEWGINYAKDHANASYSQFLDAFNAAKNRGEIVILTNENQDVPYEY